MASQRRRLAAAVGFHDRGNCFPLWSWDAEGGTEVSSSDGNDDQMDEVPSLNGLATAPAHAVRGGRKTWVTLQNAATLSSSLQR